MENYVIKWYLVSLKPVFQATDFDSVSKLLRNKKVIKHMNRIINIIYGKPKSEKFTKIILTSFISSQFTDVLTNAVNLEDDVVSYKIHNVSKKIIELFTKLKSCNKFCFNLYLKQLRDEFKILIKTYKIWEHEDSERIISELVLTYVEYEEYKAKHEDMKPYIETEQESIIEKAISLNNKYNKEYFMNKLKEYKAYKEFLLDLSNNINKNIHLAFWNSIREKLDNDPPDFKVVVPLLDDVRVLLISCVPNKSKIHEDINEYIDVPFITHMVENDALDRSYIEKMLMYIVGYLKDFQSRADDKPTEEWVKNIKALLDKGSYGEFFVNFFKTLFEKLEKIVYDANTFRRFIKESAK